MRYVLVQIIVLAGLVGAARWLGRGLVLARWGPAGLAALDAAAVIVLAGALLAALPVGLAAGYFRTYLPQVAFAATAIRLLATGALALAWEVFGRPHLEAFLYCLLALYLLLLAAETGLVAYLARPGRDAARRSQ
jgi:hypothetical protein